MWIEAQRSSVCTCCHLLAVKASQCMKGGMLNWKMKWWTVTRVIMCLLCKHGVEANKICCCCCCCFFARFAQFIQHHVRRRRFRSRDTTLLKQAGWYGLSGFELSVVGQLFIQNLTQACLLAKCTTHLKPQPCGKLMQVWVGRAFRQEIYSMLSKFTKIFWLICEVQRNGPRSV